MKKNVLIIVAVIVVVLAGLVFWQFLNSRKPPAAVGNQGNQENLPNIGVSQCLNPRVYKDIKTAAADLKSEKICILNLSAAGLTKVPDRLGQFADLTDLNLSGNQIAELPPSVFGLKNLVSLGLSENKLTQIPPEIGNLTKLRVLSLFNNKIATLPDEISKLVDLKVLGLAGNPVSQSEADRIKNLLPNAKVIFTAPK